MVAQKPVDRWLQIGSIAVGLFFWLVPKTPSLIVSCLLLIFVLLVHPIWNFWWIENRLWRRLVVLLALAVSLVLLGIATWPQSTQIPTFTAEPSLLSRVISKVVFVFDYLRGWPWRWILFSALIGAAAAGILTAQLLRRRKCRYEWVHQKASEDRQKMKDLVRIPSISYQPCFDPEGPYIDFHVSVFNGSLFDVEVNNAIGTSYIFNNTDSKKFHYPARIESDKPIRVLSRRDNFFVIRQPLRFEEIPAFEGKDKVLTFGSLEITFSGEGIDDTRLNTNHVIETQKGGWRAWDQIGFICSYSDEQWALLSSRPPKEIAAPETQTPTLSPPTPSPKPVFEPNIVYESPDTIDVHRHHRNFLRQGTWRNHSGFSTHFPALIATFRNKTLRDREIGVRGHISARLSFFGYEKGEIVTANRVAWVGTDEFRVTFGINDPHSLVVTIFENHQLCAIQENTTDDYDNPTKTIPLNGDLHLVEADLISESEGGKIISTTNLMLEVVRVPKLDFLLERVPTWKRRKLTEIVQAGRDLMERQSASEIELETEYQEWEVQAAQFVAMHLGESFTARFRPPPHVPPRGTNPAFARLSKALEPVGVYNKTRAKVEALERFRNEII